MPLDMIQVAILRVLCKPCCYKRFAMPEVAIGIGNISMPAFGAGILLKGEWLECPLQYLFQQLSACLLLLIQLHLRTPGLLD
jgi:hypothetical protein